MDFEHISPCPPGTSKQLDPHKQCREPAARGSAIDRSAPPKTAKMSEKRKPDLVIVAVIPGKRRRYRVELFRASLWPRRFGLHCQRRYRVRVQGKWWEGGQCFTWSQVSSLLRKSLTRYLW